MTSKFDDIAQETNAEYVKRRVREMVDNSKGGASVYSEITNPAPGNEFLKILIEAMIQVDNLVTIRAQSDKTTARVCILVTLEGEVRGDPMTPTQLTA